MTVLRQQDNTHVKPNARVHACLVRCAVQPSPHTRRVFGGSPYKREAEKSTMRKDCNKKAGTITHGTCALPVSRSHVDTMLHSRFHQSCSFAILSTGVEQSMIDPNMKVLTKTLLMMMILRSL